MIDPITVSVLTHRLEAIVQEMGEAMLRTAYSQILNSSRDFSTALCDGEGAPCRTSRARADPRGRDPVGGRSRPRRTSCDGCGRATSSSSTIRITATTTCPT